jgi:hypothetical protein
MRIHGTAWVYVQPRPSYKFIDQSKPAPNGPGCCRLSIKVCKSSTGRPAYSPLEPVEYRVESIPVLMGASNNDWNRVRGDPRCPEGVGFTSRSKSLGETGRSLSPRCRATATSYRQKESWKSNSESGFARRWTFLIISFTFDQFAHLRTASMSSSSKSLLNPSRTIRFTASGC